MESAEKEIRDIQRADVSSTQTQVHKVDKKTQKFSSAKKITCYCCGGNHLAPSCRFKDSVCHGCNKKGHLVRCCKNAQRRSSKSSMNIHELEEDLISQVYMLPSSKTKPLKTVVNINNKEVEMEIDTGASVSVMTHTEYKRLWSPKSRPPLHVAGIKLKMYTGCTIKIYGTCEVVVNHQGDEEKLPLIIVESEGPNLLGRDWLMDWHVLNQVQVKEKLTTLISKYSDIFQNELDTIKGISARIVTEEERTTWRSSSTSSTICTPFKGR